MASILYSIIHRAPSPKDTTLPTSSTSNAKSGQVCLSSTPLPFFSRDSPRSLAVEDEANEKRVASLIKRKIVVGMDDDEMGGWTEEEEDEDEDEQKEEGGGDERLSLRALPITTSLQPTTTTTPTPTTTTTTKVTPTPAPRPHKPKGPTCPICLDDDVTLISPYTAVSNEHFIIAPCSHKFCNDCIEGYVKFEITAGKWEVRCPATMAIEPPKKKKLRGKKRALLKKFLFKTPLPAKFATPPPTSIPETEATASVPETKPCTYQLSNDDILSLVSTKNYNMYTKRKTQDFEGRLINEDWEILKQVGVMRELKRREKLRERKEKKKEEEAKQLAGQASTRKKPFSFFRRDSPLSLAASEDEVDDEVAKPAPTPTPTGVVEGSRVRATFMNTTGHTYRGVVVTINESEQTGLVAYDDGDLWGACPLTSMTLLLEEEAGPADYNVLFEVDENVMDNYESSEEPFFFDDEIVKGLRVSARYKTMGNTRYPGVIHKINKANRTAHINYDDGDVWDVCPFDWISDDTSGSSSNACGLKTCPRCLVICHRYEGCDSMVCLCGKSFNWTEASVFSESVLDKLERRIEDEKRLKVEDGNQKPRAVRLSDDGEYVDVSATGEMAISDGSPNKKKSFFENFLRI